MALSPEKAPSSLTSPGTSARRCKYKVFLSFRGEDTRMGLVSHLYRELEWQGITTFKDDPELGGGAPISTELLSAIEDSYLAIVVLSPNYASSSWCLDELTKIVQCKDSILPIFCGVDPSDVRHQRGSFAEAFEAHERKLTSTEGREKVRQWRADLTEVANRTGWHLDKNKCERELIEDIVKCVRRKVQTTFQLFHSPDKFVERDSALNQLSELLALGENDVRFIGITGMGGIGKTSLAHRLCDSISHHFDVHCFLANVREVSASDGNLVRLQSQLLSSIFKEKVVEFWDERRRVILTKEGLRNKKVLLVLDDVDRLDQLEILAGEKDWFGNGSRIILTTRDEGLLVQHGITLSYKVEGMRYAEAHELFGLKAFKKDQLDEELLELSEHFINHAKGVPLVLETLGSFLYKRNRDKWNSVLDNLQNIPNPEVFYKLKVSYDGLQEKEQQKIFLDIACFHKGKHKQQVIDILDRRFGISSLIVIDILIERSLLTMSDRMCLEMHDLIQEMAWEIVDRESKEPGERSRIWRLDDLCHVLTANTGMEKLEAIVVNSPKLEEIRCSSEAFSNMHRLSHIELDNVMIISSVPICPPHSSRIIHWSLYPSKFLPQSFHSDCLTELTMRESKLVRLWDGKKDFPNLKYMDFSRSDKLTSTPDFTGIPNLKMLFLIGCANLVHIHPSIAVLKRLELFSLAQCKSIKSLPSMLEMDSLKNFYLGGCSKLKKVPEFSKQMKKLSWLGLDGTPIEKLPSSISNLVGLTTLELSGCKRLSVDWCPKLDKLPQTMEHSFVVKKIFKSLYSLGQGLLCSFGIRKSSLFVVQARGLVSSALSCLSCLEELNLSDCNLFEGAIPEDIGCLSSLRTLDLRGNNFVTLPTSIRWLSKLENLDLQRCKRLQELPHLPPLSHERREFLSMLHVDVSNCTSLQKLTNPSKADVSNLYDFSLYPLNCIRLVEDEGWINYVLSRIMHWATNKALPTGFPTSAYMNFVFPGSEIPEWFSNNKCEEIPPREFTNWLGIAFCVVFAEPEQGNPAAFPDYEYFGINCSFGTCPWRTSYRLAVSRDGHLRSEHIWVFYVPRELCFTPEAKILFKTSVGYGDDKEEDDPNLEEADLNAKVGLNKVKKWVARLVFEQDLEVLKQRLKILKRTHEYCCEEEGPSGSTFFNDEEPNHKRQKQECMALD